MLQAYQKAQIASESGRNVEYRLFGQVTSALLDASKAANSRARLDAIDWNRRLWSTLAVDCMDENNKLTKELRASIISLSIWVAKYSGQVMHEGASMEPLIDINRSVMQGLQAA